MHALAAQGSEQKRKACINCTQMNLFSKWYCNGNTLPHNWNLRTSYTSSFLSSVIFSWFSKVLLFLFITTINVPNLYATWLIYVPPNYKNRLELFPFKICHFLGCRCDAHLGMQMEHGAIRHLLSWCSGVEIHSFRSHIRDHFVWSGNPLSK